MNETKPTIGLIRKLLLLLRRWRPAHYCLATDDACPRGRDSCCEFCSHCICAGNAVRHAEIKAAEMVRLCEIGDRKAVELADYLIEFETFFNSPLTLTALGKAVKEYLS